MVANTGTYTDSPFHRYAEGKDLSELALESIADVEGVVCRADATPRAIGRSYSLESMLKAKLYWFIQVGLSTGVQNTTLTVILFSPPQRQHG
jgi:kynurenine formamidase